MKNKNPVELTENQKEWILKNGEGLDWGINEITKSVFGDNTKDGRSFEGKAVSTFILEHVGAKPKVRTVNSDDYKAFELEQHQIDFLLSNAKDLTTYEIALNLWPEFKDKNYKEVAFTKEVRSLQRYIDNNLGHEYFLSKNKPLHGQGGFKPPKNIERCVPLISQYTGLDIKFSKLKDDEKRSIEKLCKNLRRASLGKTVEQFRSNNEKELFLESFISDTWDKHNLTPGEVSQYVDLSGERVNLYQIKQYQQDLQEQLDDDMHSEDGKLRYTLIDAIDKQIQNRDKCMNRIQKLQDSLEGSRTKRLEKEGGDQVNILTLCEDLAKEKKRIRLTKMLEKERDKVVKVVNEIEDMTDYTARLYGASRGELLN